MECKQKINLEKCACTYPCPRKGICCECIKHHRDKNELPACYFSKDAEKTYNRSINYFLSLRK